jgi:hypothetical protein
LGLTVTVLRHCKRQEQHNPTKKFILRTIAVLTPQAIGLDNDYYYSICFNTYCWLSKIIVFLFLYLFKIQDPHAFPHLLDP